MSTSTKERDQVEWAFSYHAPKKDQPTRYTVIRDQAKSFALGLVEHCPASRELSVALEKIEEAVMWANASIARNE